MTKVSFSHVHFYVDRLDELQEYKQLEEKLNNFCASRNIQSTPVEELAAAYGSVSNTFCPQGRDLVKQWISGLGYRITGFCEGNSGTRSVLVTSSDPEGVQFIVTARFEEEREEKRGHEEEFQHFDAENLIRFFKSHAGRPGVAALAFAVDDIDSVENKYRRLHPGLVLGRKDYPEAKILQVFAYYTDDRKADQGTVLRFIEKVDPKCVLPGLKPVSAVFAQPTQPAYSDHWVSNVFSRTEFLDTLESTLGFTPKVDFNAGVVAAGEAQIESTVTGNESTDLSQDAASALRNQSQVYLPINNALSNVGHVHGFLEELGQGIQHIASRVEKLVELVQTANDWRRITGEGFTFLRIPRSYYGILTSKFLVEQVTGIDLKLADKIVRVCHEENIVEMDGAVDLSLDAESVERRLEKISTQDEAFWVYKDSIVEAILKSRYINMYQLLKDNISEGTYLGIVRNEVLVDVQGDDLLYQIFTSNILQRQAGDEAPFLEFIQRVCSECQDEKTGCPVKIKPGCGGFGIRNFLTLFLSIEVSKAMLEVADAKNKGDRKSQMLAQQTVECFTDQLNESNPILTEISEAMTREGHCKEAMSASQGQDGYRYWEEEFERANQEKQQGNQKLMECSAKYKERMHSIRAEL